MEVPDVSGELILQIPAWNALYQIRDFSTRIQQVEASVDAQHVPSQKLDKQTWRVTANGAVTIRYSTYWDDPGPFGTQLNTDHAFINPAMILMYVPIQRAEPVHVDFSDLPEGWSVASAPLPSVEGLQGNSLGASSYDALADAPIEIGKFQIFPVPGVTPLIEVVLHGDPSVKPALQQSLKRICSYEIKLMGGAPFERYRFLLHLGKAAVGGGGGMEHSNANAIYAHSEDDFANVAAHEFFHLWNVKRIRPAGLEPVDFTKEQYTRALWFAEGVTSTYGSYTLTRAGIWSKEQFYDDLASQIASIELRPAHLWQSPEQSSLDAWLEKYSLYNRPQDSVSYYTSGQVLGEMLDILIRDRTDNQHSLDDVLRSLNENFAKKGTTYRESLDIRLTAEAVAGGSFEDFFAKYVAGSEPLPYTNILSLAGLDLRITERKRPTLGFTPGREPNAGAMAIRCVDPESAAGQAGLHVGDVVVTWNGAAPPANPERWVESQKIGAPIHLAVRRDDKTVSFDLTVDQTTETSYAVTEDPKASPKARRIREGLVQGITQPVAASSK
jgi:predicted metalloprotease with PDZ domain